MPASICPSAILLPVEMHASRLVPQARCRSRPGVRSASARALREPRVLLAYDEPTSIYSAGWTRYVLERRYGQRKGR